ncbi:MAG: DUF4198 domain-containing protein [Firmicutes bacterium]|nr:DUF4198 domain-containing protein [Bacillota bacterium]
MKNHRCVSRIWVNKRLWLCVLAALLRPGMAAGHDTWLVPQKFRMESGGQVRVRLVTSEAFPEGESAVVPTRIARFFLYTAAGREEISRYRVEGVDLVADVVVPSVPAVLVAETLPREFVLEPQVFNEYLREEELETIMAARARRGETNHPGRERYRKIAKTLLCAAGAAADPSGSHPPLSGVAQGLWLEIVPTRELCGIRVGEAVSFQVLFEGRPLGGVRLAAGYAGVTGHRYPVWLVTDADGKATVRLDRPGAWFVRTLHMIAANAAQQSDWESAFSTYTFEVLPAGENAAGTDASEDPTEAVRALLEMQVEAWNRGDLDGFMLGYWNSPALTFVGAQGITRGWVAVRDRFVLGYPDRRRMGRLTFSGLEMTVLHPSAVLVLGRWQLARETDNPGGVFTLVVRKLAEGWRIVHDHTSVLE